MKPKYFYILVFSLITVTGSLTFSSAYAQDENDPTINEYKDLNQNSDLNVTEEKTLMERDHSFKPDSLHIRSAAPTQKIKSGDQSKPSSAREEDALSFNFLYYIIQKFKISDLVDDDE